MRLILKLFWPAASERFVCSTRCWSAFSLDPRSAVRRHNGTEKRYSHGKRNKKYVYGLGIIYLQVLQRWSTGYLMNVAGLFPCNSFTCPLLRLNSASPFPKSSLRMRLKRTGSVVVKKICNSSGGNFFPRNSFFNCYFVLVNIDYNL